MVRAWCVWCELPGPLPKIYYEKGLLWIHEECFQKIIDLHDDIKKVKKLLEKHKDIREIQNFLRRIEEFEKRWKGVQETLKALKLK